MLTSYFLQEAAKDLYLTWQIIIELAGAESLARALKGILLSADGKGPETIL